MFFKRRMFVGSFFIFFLFLVAPKIAGATTIDATGAGCDATVGVWDAASKTCTVSHNYDDRVLGGGGNFTIAGDGITLDGAGHTFRGSGSNVASDPAVLINNHSGVVVKNMNISYYGFGIRVVGGSSGITLDNNTITASNQGGIFLDSLSNSTISNNSSSYTASGDSFFASNSTGLTLRNNTFFGSRTNFTLVGSALANFENDIDTSNTINGRPMYYIRHASNTSFDETTDAALFYCIACTNVTVKNLSVSKVDTGVFFFGSTGGSVSGITATSTDYGIWLKQSSGIDVASSTVTGAVSDSIRLEDASGTTVENNLVTNGQSGVVMYTSQANSGNGNIVRGNSLSAPQGYGISLAGSGAIVSGNTVSGSRYGIALGGSSGTITNNTLSANARGVVINGGSGFTITRNTITSSTALDLDFKRNFDGSGCTGNTFFNNNISNSVFLSSNNCASGVSFNQPVASGGGNYWSTFDTPAEGCSDADANHICDSGYAPAASGVSDAYPWNAPSGWTIPTNLAPTLSFSSESGYAAGTSTPADGVEPNRGIASTTPFVFKIVYTDADGNQPAYVRANIDGTDYPMSVDTRAAATLHDGNFTNGEQYTYSATMGLGTHAYYFTAADTPASGASLSARTPATGTLGFDSVKRNPVIIIPGILGSWDKDGTWVMDPVLHTYDNLIDTLAANGYTRDVDLFTFPYDWRNDNNFTAILLQGKIELVKQKCGCDKVDLVAHSMGGLVARAYIQGSQYQHDVDHLIFLATPHLGAPKAYLAWEGGEFPDTTEDQVLQFILSREAKKEGYTNLFNYIKNKPISSLQQILPSYDYLTDAITLITRNYPTNYPQNSFLENINSNISSLYNSNVTITNVVGSTTKPTIAGYDVLSRTDLLPKWVDGYPSGFYENLGDRGIQFGLGDGTVPLVSANYINHDINEVNAEHTDIPTASEGLIYNKLIGQTATHLVTSHGFDLSSIDFLFVKILSPVDVQIVAPDGKRVGKDFTTGQEINEIPDAFYSGFLTDDEYAVIPNPEDGEYKVVTQGTGSGGEYTVATGYISDATSTSQDFSGQTIPGAMTNLNVAVNNENPSDLHITPADTIPPVVSIASPHTGDYLRSSLLPITTSATDTDSGIATSSILFDARAVANHASVDLFFEHLGNHVVSISATDLVNNTASTSVSFRVITTFNDSISDTNRSYALTWIKTTKVRDYIISKFAFARDNPKKSKSTLNSLGGYLDGQLTKKTINQQAHDVLKEDVNWLLTH